MATFTATRGASTFPVADAVGSSVLQVAYGTIEVAANPTDGDIYEMCKLPACTIVGGWVLADALETNATPALDIDLGWAANGTDAADPDGLANLGAWDDAVNTGGSGRVAAQCEFNLFHQKNFIDGDFPTLSADTTIQFECNTTASTFAAGALSVVIFYVTD